MIWLSLQSSVTPRLAAVSLLWQCKLYCITVLRYRVYVKVGNKPFFFVYINIYYVLKCQWDDKGSQNQFILPWLLLLIKLFFSNIEEIKYFRQIFQWGKIQSLCFLTLILPEPKVISLCHLSIMSNIEPLPACKSIQSDLRLYTIGWPTSNSELDISKCDNRLSQNLNLINSAGWGLNIFRVLCFLRDFVLHIEGKLE